MTYPVIKHDASDQEVLRYSGEIIAQDAVSICVRATFTLATRDLRYVVLKQGDTFVEWFYADRWYNVFLLYDVDNGAFKGCYCNLTRPADITPVSVTWADLALDIWVFPNGETLLLDEDEYRALDLSASDDALVQAACVQIRASVARRDPPFDALTILCQGE